MTEAKFTVRAPEDLVAMVPIVLGFHPEESVAALTFGPTQFHARIDLPTGHKEQVSVAEILLDAMTRNQTERVAFVSFTADASAHESQIELLASACQMSGIEVLASIRYHDGVLYTGGETRPCDIGSHAFTAQSVYDTGRVVRGSRADLSGSIAPTQDIADRAAVERHANIVTGPFGNQARWVVARLAGYDTTRPLDAQDAGRLTGLMTIARVRDVAMACVTAESSLTMVGLWSDLVRRAPEHLVSGVGSMLAFSAWCRGDGALAWCALDRAAAVDPQHPLVQLMGTVLRNAMPPSEWKQVALDDLPVFAESH